MALAVAIAVNALAGLQREVPGYSDALQGSAKIRDELSGLTGAAHTSLAHCNPNATGLVNCGPAPDITGITGWLNTAGDRPLSQRRCAARSS